MLFLISQLPPLSVFYYVDVNGIKKVYFVPKRFDYGILLDVTEGFQVFQGFFVYLVHVYLSFGRISFEEDIFD